MMPPTIAYPRATQQVCSGFKGPDRRGTDWTAVDRQKVVEHDGQERKETN